MIDWAGRVDDVAHLLSSEHSVEDRQAVEILLAAQIACPRTSSVWMVLETNWYSRQCLDAWFSFGENWEPCSLSRLRARAPWRQVEAEVKELLDHPEDDRLFVEGDYDRYPYFHRLTQAMYLLQRSIRIRTKRARGGDPLQTIDRSEFRRRHDRLQTAARGALEDRLGARPQDPPVFRPPENFLYHVELVQRLAPWFPDWDDLVKAFGAIAVKHAYLFGRTETGPDDYRALARIARDSVPVWILKAVGMMLERPSKGPDLNAAMRLEDKTRRSGHGAVSELRRLKRAGLIDYRPRLCVFEVLEEHRQGLADVVGGTAFGVEKRAPVAAVRTA